MTYADGMADDRGPGNPVGHRPLLLWGAVRRAGSAGQSVCGRQSRPYGLAFHHRHPHRPLPEHHRRRPAEPDDRRGSVQVHVGRHRLGGELGVLGGEDRLPAVMLRVGVRPTGRSPLRPGRSGRRPRPSRPLSASRRSRSDSSSIGDRLGIGPARPTATPARRRGARAAPGRAGRIEACGSRSGSDQSSLLRSNVAGSCGSGIVSRRLGVLERAEVAELAAAALGHDLAEFLVVVGEVLERARRGPLLALEEQGGLRQAQQQGARGAVRGQVDLVVQAVAQRPVADLVVVLEADVERPRAAGPPGRSRAARRRGGPRAGPV